ncbi:uncharacterized protein LOC104887820 [Beta vulgaris subsp. vulgaris]|uniref:uncharacterized protein LOC104887820 n=1 Tax=Beta vulgaris subsp. vulgaris TaxID=3555 RepID=UPI00053FE136|nr:uncharacterized protein LOC104887820 [Beta vulgaris subsp. vulgaris]
MSVKGNEESKSSNKRNLHFRSDHQRPRTPAAAEREMGSKERESKGYAWALAAGFTAALAAISAKYFSSQLVKYSLVIAFNVTMWGCYVNSLRALSSLQATVTNFAMNFLSSGLAGFFLFGETLSTKWFTGAFLIVVGVFILTKSSLEKKENTD